MDYLFYALGGFGLFIAAIFLHDVFQRKHAILHNFPLVGHFRYLLESLGPELRQYFFAKNDEERPFSRDQRRWVYASSKKANNYFGFGTDNDLEETPNYLIIKQSQFPISTPRAGDANYDPNYLIPCAKVLGGPRKRAKAFTPESAVFVSGMSFGSLGRTAVEAMNKGSALAKCIHNTGEGGISKHHDHGADLMLQIGTAYFGCRGENGEFSMAKLKESVEKFPKIRAIEIKMSQGGKPGLGGLLPKEKITAEIAEARGIPRDRDCVSPAGHTAFSDADSLLDFVESIAAETGLPVGIKSAVGELDFWKDLAKLMSAGNRGLDFVVIDGGEGGTGAGPLVYTDHVALPFKLGFSRVHHCFSEQNIADKVVFVGSAKLGFPEQALFAFALGCDMIAVGREAMLSIGCIQAQICQTGHCPAGVATHNKWLMAGLDPTLKSARLANYITELRHETLKLTHTCGLKHPSEVTLKNFEMMDGQLGSVDLPGLFR